MFISDPVELEDSLTDPLRNAIAKVVEALRLEQFYLNGKISVDDFAEHASDFVRCTGQPLNEGGDFVCSHCAAGYVMRGIELQRTLDRKKRRAT